MIFVEYGVYDFNDEYNILDNRVIKWQGFGTVIDGYPKNKPRLFIEWDEVYWEDTHLRWGYIKWKGNTSTTLNKNLYRRKAIVWHPMNRARLTYLRITKCSLHSPEAVKKSEPYFNDLHDYFYNNEETLIQTVLDRPEELQDKVIAFLDTLPKDEL